MDTTQSPPPPTSHDWERLTNRSDPPIYEQRLSPHRSLSNTGFATTILFTASALCLPLLAFIGTYALWTLLPFLGAALAALWYFIRRNDHDGTLCEHVRIWPDLIAIHRKNPRTADQYWHANPYWVQLKLRDTKAVENYLTLKGNGREIELGAFLTSDARVTLHKDLQRTFALSRAP